MSQTRRWKVTVSYTGEDGQEYALARRDLLPNDSTYDPAPDLLLWTPGLVRDLQDAEKRRKSPIYDWSPALQSVFREWKRAYDEVYRTTWAPSWNSSRNPYVTREEALRLCLINAAEHEGKDPFQAIRSVEDKR